MANQYTGYRDYTPEELSEWIPALIHNRELWRFYVCHAWLHVKQEVLIEQHHECQICKKQGKATPTTTVHHVIPVRVRPELALTKSNLMAVCPQCHYKIHHGDHSERRGKPKGMPQWKWREVQHQEELTSKFDDEKW